MAESKFGLSRFRALPTPPQQGEPRQVKKRNRIPVSCRPCRSRRSKCDRGHPCATCTKRDEAQLCSYTKPGSKQSSRDTTSDEIGTTHNAQDRLRHLESLVMQMVQRGQDSSPSTANSAEYASMQNGSVYQSAPTTDSSSQKATADSGRPHWTSILNGIHELASIIGPGEETLYSNEDPPHLMEKPLLLGISAPPSLQHVLQQYLPPRTQLDRRLSAYYHELYMVLPIIIPQQFQDEYQRFWLSPSTADPIWVALLFAILSLSANITRAKGIESDAQPQEQFLNASAQCLTLGGYTKPRKYLMEALVLVCQARYMNRLDPSREVALLVSIITRLAFQSGLHREPPKTCTPFEAEIRRRCWLVCLHFDVQVACQLGVPPTIPVHCHNVSEPRNLHNEDLSEDMPSLPPSRPENEVTTILAFILKSRLIRILAEVYEQAISLGPSNDSDAEILRLDAALRHEYARMPSRYRIRPMGEAFTDSDHLVMARLTCYFLAQKSICILHRKRMAAGNGFSRRACVDAAVSIVRELTEFYAEFQPGGRLAGQQWMLSLTILNDFLLATMVLCLSLVTGEATLTGPERPELEGQGELLQKAREVCLDLSPKSRGAGRVAEAVELLLTKLRICGNTSPSVPTMSMTNPQALPTPATFSQAGSGSSYPDPQLQQQSLADAVPAFPTNPQISTLTFDPFDRIMADSTDIDWTAFDQYINTWDPW